MAADQAIVFELGQRRIDRAETGLDEIRAFALDTQAPDFVSGSIASVEDGQANCSDVHTAALHQTYAGPLYAGSVYVGRPSRKRVSYASKGHQLSECVLGMLVFSPPGPAFQLLHGPPDRGSTLPRNTD
jgi:hypothetical protein